LANANPQLASGATGKDAPVGMLIKGVSTGAVMTTGFGTIECKEVVLGGEVTVSESEGAEADGTGEGTATTCSSGGVSISLVAVKWPHFTIHFDHFLLKADVSFTFKGILPLIGTYTFTGTDVPFTYVSGASPVVITFDKGPLSGSPSICAGSSVDGHFTLTEAPGGALRPD